MSRLLRKKSKTVNTSVRKICDEAGIKIPDEDPEREHASADALGDAIGKITRDNAKKADKLRQILQLIASLSEEE